MRKLSATETYAGSRHFEAEPKKAPSTNEELERVRRSGYINPEILTDTLDRIKDTPVIINAKKMLKDGKIVLLNPIGNNGEYLLGVRIPFFMVGSTMYVNMTRWGKWNADKSGYVISAISELAPVLTSAYLTYSFLQSSQKLVSDIKVVESATRAYIEMMVGLLKGFGINLSDSDRDDNTTYIRYLCGKFFLLYVLDKSPSPSIDEMAFKAAKVSNMNKLSIDVLQMREDGDEFLTDPDRYGTLYGFLNAIMESTRTNIEINSPKVYAKFNFLYGEQVYHSIDYFPYMLFYLMAAESQLLYKLNRKLVTMKTLNASLQQLKKEIMAKS